MNTEPSESDAGKPAAGKPLTVLQVLPSLVTGGVERGTVDIAEALVTAGHRAVVASLGGHMVRELDKIGATHHVLPLKSKNPWIIWRNIARLVELIRAEGVDIVHARSRAPAWSAYYAARRAGVPFVTTVHGVYGHASRAKRLYNSVMVRGERVIAISEFIRDHILSVHPEVDPARIVVVPRGVDLTQYFPGSATAARMIQLSEGWAVPPGAPMILVPGRLTRLKGQTVAIEALAKLPNSDAVMVFAGGDIGREAYKLELRALAAKLGVESRVRFVGVCRDMPAAYSLASVVVSASIEPEGFGRTAVEGQAMGRPVVVTDHGGSRETVTPGVTGWRVPPDNVDALAGAIGEALALGDAERAALAARSIAHVRQDFTQQLMSNRTLAVYDSLRA
ncbi:MAG: glycosyltransferase family 4 protein [Pseudomonadota bacterium]|nr:glycosyltransferase family 4 protein [Pseudomonadota bacterium]